ncbi:MAG: hypothetical protein ACRDC6_16600 [Shewanella sp.]
MSKEETKRVTSRDVECGQVIRINGVDFKVIRKNKDFERMQMCFLIRPVDGLSYDSAVRVVRFDFINDYVEVVG